MMPLNPPWNKYENPSAGLYPKHNKTINPMMKPRITEAKGANFF